MMRVSMIGMLIIGTILSGCGERAAMSGPGAKSQGRYAGIGTYPTGRLWQQAAEAAEPSDAAMAKLEDDENVIVVIDSHTGEVRQCGDHSGFCVTMNPWAAQGARTGAPVKLKKHAADLEAEDQTDAEQAEPVTNASAPAQ
jgi:hypothetical protein